MYVFFGFPLYNPSRSSTDARKRPIVYPNAWLPRCEPGAGKPVVFCMPLAVRMPKESPTNRDEASLRWPTLALVCPLGLVEGRPKWTLRESYFATMSLGGLLLRHQCFWAVGWDFPESLKSIVFCLEFPFLRGQLNQERQADRFRLVEVPGWDP